MRSKLSAVNNAKINVLGTITLPFKIGTRTYCHRTIVCNEVTFPGAVLLGTDLLRRLDTLQFSLNEGIVTVQGCTYRNLPEYTKTSSLICSMNKPHNEDDSWKATQQKMN